MKCPNCSAAAPEGAAECPGCGVIFAKLAKVEERKAAETAAMAALLAAPPPAETGPDPLKRRRVIAAVVVVAWLVLLSVAVHRSMRRARPRAGAGPDEAPSRTVTFVDSRTGASREVPLHDWAKRAVQAEKAPDSGSHEASWVEEEKAARR